MAEKKVIELEVKTDLPNMTQQLRQAQREVTALSEKFGATSQEAINAAKRAAELKDAIGDAKALTDAFNPDAKFNALSASISGVLNGFQAYEGALGLIGVESKAVEETLLKVQSAMALSQGVQGLLEAKDSFMQLGAVIKTQVVTAFSTLKGAIMATGIGALVAVIGVLVYKMNEYNDELLEAAENQKKFSEALQKTAELREKQRNSIQGGLNDLKRELELKQAQGKSEEELYNIRKKILDKELFNQEVRLATFTANNEKEKEIRIDAKNNIENIQNQIKVLDATFQKGLTDAQKEANAKRLAQRKEANNKILAEELRLRDQLKADILANDQEQIDANKLKTEKLLEQEQAYADAVAEARKYNIESVLSDQEKEIKAINDKYAKIAELGELNKDLIIAQKNEINAVNVEYAQKEVKLEQLTAEKKIEIAKQTSNDLIAIVEFIGTRNKKAAKVAFNVTKALNIANAVMDTYKAATNALANVPAPYNFVAAGVSIVAGLANVAKIASQKFDESGGSNVPSGGGSIAGGSTTAGLSQQTAPSFNLVGQSGGGQFLQQQPIQAYVVSGEVTSQQSLDRNRLFNATFG